MGDYFYEPDGNFWVHDEEFSCFQRRKVKITYSSLQYVNQCCESVSERKHKGKKKKLCSFMLFGRILFFLLDQWRKSLKIVAMFPEISLEFSFC
jgi:hypothetical protein